MPRLSSSVVDAVVENCLDFYEKLPKSGKPGKQEWTVLSCVVEYDTVSGIHRVVSLGTGSKCIGATEMTPRGDLLNDSHGEVVARRGFLLYVYDNIKNALQNKSSIFTYKDTKFFLKESIEFLFYSSQLPCGDASIFPKSEDEEFTGDLLDNKRKADDDLPGVVAKKAKTGDLAEDLYRTGAKCLPESEQDPKLPGTNYHLLGRVRTKPGRGDRTLSVSCSDKIARWVHAGIQGALIDMLCGPIYIKHFIFGSGTPYSTESLSRAILKRGSESCQLDIVPEFYQSKMIYLHVRNDYNIRPAPGSIVWMRVLNQWPEVAVQGRKLGLTKKKAVSPKHSLCISKYKLYETFVQVLKSNEDIKNNICGDTPITEIPYNDMKRKSKRYLETWALVKQNFFKSWTVKPDMWNFCVEET